MTRDVAGKSHWDEMWATPEVKPIWDPRRNDIDNTVVCAMHAFISRHISGDRARRILEVGCGASASLPYLAQYFDAEVVGIDYSEEGCQRADEIAKAAGIRVTVVQADFFSPPNDLLGSFDVVISFGVVEHFSDTKAAIQALTKFLLPGGGILTLIPNLCGTIGETQKFLDRSVYDKHVVIDRRQLHYAHEDCGLIIEECAYLLSTNFGVCNVPRKGKSGLEYWVKRIYSALLLRFSRLIWLLERWGAVFPRTREFSPYVVCAGRRPIRPVASRAEKQA